jgi:hypothetical protein
LVASIQPYVLADVDDLRNGNVYFTIPQVEFYTPSRRFVLPDFPSALRLRAPRHQQIHCVGH